jgi:hypothetical protein
MRFLTAIFAIVVACVAGVIAVACIGETATMAFGSCGMEISRLSRELSKPDQSFFTRKCMMARGFDSGRDKCGWAEDASCFSPLTTLKQNSSIARLGAPNELAVRLTIQLLSQLGKDCRTRRTIQAAEANSA